MTPLLLSGLVLTGASVLAGVGSEAGGSSASGGPHRATAGLQETRVRPARDPVVVRDIFGAARHGPVEERAGGVVLSESLVLETTVIAPSGSYAVAWIGPEGQRAQPVAVGDARDGWMVVDIAQRTVLLERDGGLRETVAMRGENPETTRRATSRTPSAGAAFSGRNPPPSGYRLSGLAAGDPLFEQGLRNGDVVHAVAGVAVATGQALHLAFETARLVGPVDVDLTRNGKRSTLSLLLP